MVALEHPPLACRPSLPQGGRMAASSAGSSLRRWRLAKAAECVISLVAGEMAGRPEGGAKELGLHLRATQ
ncbi:hypothetical protein EOA85_23165 [Mesorhizobium sp. M5C.F.Ca.IN.020.29.1.1]|nr:hypothetical protein EOA85_23165 [Mesorhizobium sp. M5C.F.Ca.IN.020.29.1.1]TIM88643.1 MAG: hypothetical protein E5Y50_07915 [Mesorhizobium sp.]TIX80936.1 MAG: hypothetical protein E5V27_17930 [Mesorhizobium sp.]